MRELPINLKIEEARAILDGSLTQLRRILKPQPYPCSVRYCGLPIPHWHTKLRGRGKGRVGWHSEDVEDAGFKLVLKWNCRYKVGDRVWGRETWCPVDDRPYGGENWFDYRATPRYEACHPAGWENDPECSEALKWRSSAIMPREACRIHLEVTGVEVVRDKNEWVEVVRFRRVEDAK